jgi:hypothetical protein
MPEIKKPKTVYKVTITEYERGYGQRHIDDRYFDNENDAKSFCKTFNNDNLGDIDCFFRAKYEKII